MVYYCCSLLQPPLGILSNTRGWFKGNTFLESGCSITNSHCLKKYKKLCSAGYKKCSIIHLTVRTFRSRFFTCFENARTFKQNEVLTQELLLYWCCLAGFKSPVAYLYCVCKELTSQLLTYKSGSEKLKMLVFLVTHSYFWNSILEKCKRPL